MTNSDVETVCDNDSPLSPCLWTPNEVVDNQRQTSVPEPTKGKYPEDLNVSSRFDYHLPTQQHELQLSPASQLNVLSHISELADASSRQTDVMSRLLPQETQRSNVWGAALQTAKRKETLRSVVTSRSRSKRHKNEDQKPMQSQAARLATDMLDWETCSEGDLFTLEEEMEEDQWNYQEIYDSEFEGESTAS
ncbi:unnamed protein product [Peronospora destructor]|uniref:Uncharacterized protein n=1 Tax=Peronospora destructor TaxID=86335 RepID=A0AAV0TJR1_9STRA|nr:unnamed protein product [Peronospora destructor]